MQSQANAALVQTRFENIEPDVLVQVLSRLTLLPRAEVLRIARKQRGILHEHLTTQVAAKLAMELNTLNIGATSVPAHELPELSKPRTALWIEPDEAGFGVPLDHLQVLERINWLSVFAIHAELLTDPQAKTDKISQRFPNVDVVAIGDSGKLIHFRISQPRFAPGRMPWIAAQQPLADKFYQLLELLIQRSTAAIISPTARRLLVERPASTHALAEHWLEEKDERTMANYLRWLVWLAMHREQQLAK